jgi:hypothetical protein
MARRVGGHLLILPRLLWYFLQTMPNYLPVLKACAVFYPHLCQRHIIRDICQYVGEGEWLEWDGVLKHFISPVTLVKSVSWALTDNGTYELAADVKVWCFS